MGGFFKGWKSVFGIFFKNFNFSRHGLLLKNERIEKESENRAYNLKAYAEERALNILSEKRELYKILHQRIKIPSTKLEIFSEKRKFLSERENLWIMKVLNFLSQKREKWFIIFFVFGTPKNWVSIIISILIDL